MKIEGKLLAKFKTVQVSGSFKKQEFVIEFAENPDYPQTVIFQLTQEKCGIIDPFPIGTALSVEFNLRGRSWTAPDGEVKYFNTLEAWRLEAKGGVVPEVKAKAKTETPEGDDDLPF